MADTGESGTEARVGRVLAAVVDASRRGAPLVVLAVALATAFCAVYSARNLGINADTESLISERVPYMKLRFEFDRALPMADDILLLVIDADTPQRAAEAADALAARFEGEPEVFQGVFVPGGGPFFTRQALLYLDLDELEDLSLVLAQAQPFLAEISRDPSLRGVFQLLRRTVQAMREGEIGVDEAAPLLSRVSQALEAAAQGSGQPGGIGLAMLGRAAQAEEARRVVILSPRLDYTDLQPARRAVESVRRAIAETHVTDGSVRARLTGDFALSFDEMQVVKQQALGAAASSFVLVGLLLVAALRSAWLIFASLALLVSGLVLNLGFAVAAVGHLNPISVAFAVLFIGLGVDYAIHFCLHYQDQRRAGASHTAGLASAAREVGGSIVLCAGATAIGFYSFVPTDFKGVAELGLISGTGMLIAFALTLTLLPALLSLAPARVQERWSLPPRGRRFAEIEIPTAHPSRVLLVTLAIAAVALALLPRAYFDHNPLRVRDPNTESVQAFRDLLASAGSSPWTLSVLARDAGDAEAVAGRLRDLPVVDRVVTPGDLVPAEQESKLEIIREIELFLGPSPAANPAPPRPDEELAALDALTAELDAWQAAGVDGSVAASATRLRDATSALHGRLAPEATREAEVRALRAELVEPIAWRLRRLHAAFAAEPFGFEDLPKSLRDQLVAVDGRMRVEIFPAEDMNDNAALARFVDGVRTVEPAAVGPAGHILMSARAIVDSFQEALAGAAVAIAALLFVLWRRVGDTLLVMGILGLSTLLTTAGAVVANIPFNFADVIVLPLLLGACVESSVHLVHRHRTEVTREGELLKTSTARAVLYTALTTIASFGTLGFATHRGLATMGRLLTIGLLLNLACNLVVLPALLNYRPARRR